MSGTIKLKQQIHSTGWNHCRCTDCAPNNLGPQWDYVSPLPDMQSRGLTPTVLRGIVEELNTMSADHYASNFDPMRFRMSRLGLWLFVIGFVLGLWQICDQLFLSEDYEITRVPVVGVVCLSDYVYSRCVRGGNIYILV